MSLLCGAVAQVTFQKVSWCIQSAGLGPAQSMCKPNWEWSFPNLSDSIKTIKLVHLVPTLQGRTASTLVTVAFWRYTFWDFYCASNLAFYMSVWFFVSRNLEKYNYCHDRVCGGISLILLYSSSVVFYSWGTTSQNSSNFGFKGWISCKCLVSIQTLTVNQNVFFSLWIFRVHMIYLSGTARFQLPKRLSI